MLFVLNITVIALVLLIAYWWATQGAFSAIIHLLCVIVAGALALAFWEPLTMGLLLRGTGFDVYAWGVSLVGIFVVVLVGLRLLTNKLLPANVDLPRWANLALGFPVGAFAGVLSIGMLILGAGHVQSERQILGFAGYARSTRDGQVKELQRLWLPCHQITDVFYSWLSVNALRSGQPLRQYSPDLYRQAAGLVRDSFKGGKGQVALIESAATIQGTYLSPPNLERCAVRISFGRDAKDFGKQLTISASQLRLIGAAAAQAKPYVAHPVRWSQRDSADRVETFLFDDLSHYITSVAGQDNAEIVVEFPLPAGVQPRFIQIKGTRFMIPEIEEMTASGYDEVLGRALESVSVVPAAETRGVRAITSPDIRVANDIRPVLVSTNELPPGIKANKNNYLVEGDGFFRSTRKFPSRELRLLGIYEPVGTKIVKVDVSRGSSADIYGSVLRRVGSGATPQLVDSRGNPYTAIGLIHERPDGVRIKLDPRRGIDVAADLPHLPTTGNQKLTLLFRITEGVTIVSFRLGDVVVGTCSVKVG